MGAGRVVVQLLGILALNTNVGPVVCRFGGCFFLFFCVWYKYCIHIMKACVSGVTLVFRSCDNAVMYNTVKPL